MEEVLWLLPRSRREHFSSYTVDRNQLDNVDGHDAGRSAATHDFATLIPDELEDGVVYSLAAVPWPCTAAAAAAESAITPLDPAQWSLTYDGQTVSLDPSIAGGRCQLGTIITRGVVRWARPLRSASTPSRPTAIRPR